MIKEIYSLDGYMDYIEEFRKDEAFSDPHMAYNEDNLFGAFNSSYDRVFAVREDDRITGLFVWKIEAEERYIEMIIGMSKEESAYMEMIEFVEEGHPGFQMDYVFNPKNYVLKKVLEKKNASIDPEQMKLELKKQVPHEVKHTIQLLSKEYEEQYKALHNDEGRYWTAEKVLAATDMFRVFLALDGNEVVGYLDITYSYEENEPYDMFIKQGFEYMGYEQDLLAEAIKRNGKNRMMVLIDVENTKEIEIYSAVGFEPSDDPNSRYATYHIPET